VSGVESCINNDKATVPCDLQSKELPNDTSFIQLVLLLHSESTVIECGTRVHLGEMYVMVCVCVCVSVC